MSRPRRVFTSWIERFINLESKSSIFLGLCTLLAMLIANSQYAEIYFNIFEMNILNLSLLHWINDALMAIFFFVIGLEIKREFINGSLSSIKKSAFPIAAAMGGMLAPALIFCLINSNEVSLKGWAIPTATDIAFALGVLSFLGKRVPLSLKIFLLTLAVADDIGAIFIIAIFYTHKIHWIGCIFALFAGLAGYLSARKRVISYYIYAFIGVSIWLGVFYSGIHPTIAGVIMGFIIPYRISNSTDLLKTKFPVDDLIYKLQPWVSFGIMPIFAFANAGISLVNISPLILFKNSISFGVFLGLVFGKPLGIMLVSWFTVFLGLTSKPKDLKWRNLIGVSFLAGIGFTMAMFITNLSLTHKDEEMAKLAILAGSTLAGIIGYLILKTSLLKSSEKA